MQQDPASQQALNSAADSVESAATAIELAALGVVASALGSITASTTYAKMRAQEARDLKAIEQALKRGNKLLKAQSGKLLDNMADATDDWAAKYYTAASKKQIKAAQNANIKPTLDAGKKATQESIDSLCRTSVIQIVSPDGKLLPIAKAYRAHVDNAILAMSQGEQTYQTAIAKAVNDLASYGLRVRYESGATRELYAAVRTNVMDGYRTTMAGIRSTQGREFGADGVEVTAHGLCAPDHQPYQGRQYSKRDFDRLNASLERPLVTGANCHHSTFPVILGVSSEKYTDDQLQEIINRSNAEVTFNGLSGQPITMTRYDATQYQRKVEGAIRQNNMAASLADSASASTDAKRKARELTAYYKVMSKDAGLTTRIERTQAYTLK